MKTRANFKSLTLFAILLVPVSAFSNHQREDWAEVLEAVPVKQTVRRPADHEVCWDEEVYYPVQERRSPTPLILGAIVGGVIGNQFGGGRGNELMTVAGAALGTSVAADRRARRHPQGYYRDTQERCTVERAWIEEERIIGWDVTYEYLGEVYSTRMDEPPGDRIRVRVAVQPVR